MKLDGRGVRLTAAAAALLVVGAARGASAQTYNNTDRERSESEQNFLLEIRVGTWLPAVDDEFSSRGLSQRPFADVFGTNGSVSPAIYGGGEFDWQIVRIAPVMQLGVGLSIGYGNLSAPAPLTASMTMPDPSTWTRSTETTSLNALPVTLDAVLRFDGLARHVSWFPVVPYVKLGVAYTFWWVNHGGALATSNSAGTNVGSGQEQGLGGSIGTHVAGGLALSLEVFERSVQRQWDATSGVNHSYLFFEVYNTWMGFGQQLNLGTTQWTAGVAVEF